MEEQVLDAFSEFRQTHLVLNSLSLGDMKVRFLFFRRPSFIYSSTSKEQSEDVMLFFGSDLFKQTKLPENKLYLTHQKHGRDGHSIKLTLGSVRFDSISEARTGVRNTAWFYTVHGLFKVAFLYLNNGVQRDCLDTLREEWMGFCGSSPLPPAANVNVVSYDGATQSVAQETTVRDQCLDEELINGIRVEHSYVASVQTTEDNTSDVRQGDTYLDGILCDIRNKIKVRARQRSSNTAHEDEKLSLLKEILEAFQNDVNVKAGDCFPYHLLGTYNTIVKGACKASFDNSFGIPLKRNVALSTICEWLGQELNKLQNAIKEKLVVFKQQHIDCIDNLPPPFVLMQQLFPNCMLLLIMNWMDPRRHDEVVEIQAGKTTEQNHSDHYYGRKRTGNSDRSGSDTRQTSDSQTPSEDSNQSSSPSKRLKVMSSCNKDVYPFAQLVLELTNDALISGVAHVICTRLLADDRSLI